MIIELPISLSHIGDTATLTAVASVFGLDLDLIVSSYFVFAR